MNIINTSRLLPETARNDYDGHWIAKGALVVLTIITLARSLVHILAPDGGAQSIATIPLDSYSAEAADAVVNMFGLWGVSQLLLGIVFVVVLFRYSNLIPLMWLFVVGEYSGRIAVGVLKGLETTGTAPGEIGNYVLVPLGMVFLFLSLTDSGDSTVSSVARSNGPQH